MLLLTVLFVQSVEAGIMPASSRMIYRDGDREKTLMLVNTNDYPVLVQSWVDNGEGSPEAASPPFVVLPPVFRLAARRTQGLRIIYNHDPLPQDRESAFWLNLYEMPPETPHQDPTHLTLAMNTQLKVFYNTTEYLFHLHQHWDYKGAARKRYDDKTLQSTTVLVSK